MAILRRYNRYQGLKDLDVLIDDDAPISQYFNVVEVPDIITQGRSSFLVGGSPLLKDHVELKFEIINDESGKVIYTEPVSNYLEGTSRRVSIEVYDDPDTFGDATMYVVGELNPNEVQVPPEWQDVYNIRWYSKIYISGTGVNTEPIFFYKQPSMWVGEIVKGFVETNYPTSSVTQSAGTVTGDPLPGTEGTIPGEEAPGDIVETLQKSYVSKVFGGGGKNAGFSSRGRRARRMSPEVETFTINLDGGTATALHVGATFTVNSPKAASSFVTESYHEFPDTFETTIKNVKNDSTLIPTKEFTIIDTRYPVGDTQRDLIVPLEETAYTMSFQPAPTHSVSTVNFRSFADIRISKLRTFSGDVHRVKLYSKNKDAFGDFELIADTPIESPELLYDVYSSAGSRRVGYFDSQNTINTYWATDSYTTASLDSTYILDSVYLSGSNKEENSILRFQSTGSLPITFYKDIEYSVRANIIGRKGSKIEGNTSSSYAELGIFLSGSSFVGNHNYGNSFGYQLVPPGQTEGGLLKVNVTDGTLVDFGIVEEVFTPLYNGQGILQFGAPAGSWYISDVSITPVADTGFSPDWIRIVAPVPPLSNERPDDYEFIAEFYDVNNNIADTISHVSASTFAGGNSYILGDDNVLSGSMFIGNAIGSGIEMAGVGSGFVRSIGYKGFTSASAYPSLGPGFMMWSGSVLTDVTDEYSTAGVGLELVGHSGSYFRFRTEPSELDIRADTFFVGNPSSQFISGSGDNIEISSSNFHVDPGGDVTMTGTVTAEAGNIGDWQIIDGKLSGSKATLDAVGAALYHTTKGPGSDSPPGGFHQLRDEYYIDFTPDEGPTATAGEYYVKFGPNFSVSSSGILFASGAVFEGTITASAGLIGGWSIEDTYIGSVPDGLRLYGNSSDSPYHISSSDFQVRTTGEITASAGLIGGWTITDGYISNALSGSVAYQDYTRVYLSATTDDDKNIAEGLHVYRKDEDVEDGEVKIVRVGGLSDTTDLHANNDYGIQVIQKDSDTNYSNVMYIGESTQTISNFSINPVAIHSSDKSLILSGSGEITGSQVLFTGGKIGGWTLTDTTLTGGVVTLNSAGSIEVGSLANATTTATTNSGFFADSSGNVLIKGNVSGNDYLKISAGGSVDIKAQVFDLATTQMILDSATNSGKIALGSTPPTGFNSGNGIYMDGNANFLVGSASADHIQYSADDGVFDIQVGSLELDATNIEISSTKASMSLGEGKILLDGANSKVTIGSTSTKQITLQGHADYGYIATGKTSATSTTAGFWLANNETDPEFHVGNSTDFIKFDGGELDIQSQKLEISSSTLQVSTTQASMSFGHSATYPQGKLIMEGLGTPTFKMGPDVDIISMTTGSGVYMDGDGNFRFGDDDGGITFNNGSFAITGSDIDISVTDINVSATGFQLSSQQASMSLGTNREWLAKGGDANPYQSIGQSTVGYGKQGVFLGYVSSVSRPRVSFSGSAGHFLFDSGVDIDTTTFELDANDGDLQISSTQKSMSLNDQTVVLDGANAKIVIGSDATKQVTIQGGANDNFMVMGTKEDFSDFDQSTQGIIIGMDSTVPKFEFAGSATNYISYDGSNFDIKLSQGLELAATNIQLSSAQASMSLGGVPGDLANITLDGGNSKIQVGATGSNSITLQGGAADNYMVMGSKSSFTHFDKSTAGIIIGMDSTVPKLEMVGSATNYLSFDGSNFDIKLSQGLELDASNIEISSTHASMSLGSANDINLDGVNKKITIGSANAVTIQGGGTDNYIVMGNKNDGSGFGSEGYASGDEGILIGMDAGNPQAEFVKSSTNYFIFDGTSGIDIKTTNFELDANTGDLQLSSAHKSMSLGDGKVILQGASAPYMVLNSGSNAITLKAETNDAYITMGSKTSFTHYDKSTVGIILGMDTAVPKFEMAKDGDEYLRWDSTDGLDIRTKHIEVSASNLEISSLQASMSIGDPNSSGGAIVLHADGTDKMLKFGSKTTFDQDDAGLIMGMDATDPRFDYTVSATQYLRMKTAGIAIATPSFKLDTDRLDIDSDLSRIDVYDDSGGSDGSDLRVRIGEVDPTTANHYGMVIYDGTGSGSADELVHFSDAKNQIASWSLSSTQITSENLIIDSAGILQTSDFASGLKGWRITSANSGEAEFEKVTVRGTLSTTVFEKESVNAVGGQLYVANSTIYTGSAALTANNTTMSVANVGGFSAGEILSAKKISATGFATEYMYVESASRYYPSSETDLRGNLYLIRGYGVGITGESGSLGDAPTISQSYENGQVVVSTGKTGTGFIRLNANPNDTTTPYIDIVERTGSGVYDIDLKARLGDLSGLSSGLLYGETNPGFGLFTDNVFLSGAITAQTGSIEGILHVRTDALNQIMIGTNVSASADGIYINDNNYWFTDDSFRIGDTNNYFEWDTSTLTIKPQTLEINAGSGDFQISSTHKSMSFGNGDIYFQSLDSSNSRGRIGSNTSNAIYISGSSAKGYIYSGKSTFGSTTAGFWLGQESSTAKFHIGDSTDFIKFNGSNITIKTRAFELDADTGDLQISSTQHSMSFADGTLKLGRASSGISYVSVGSTLGKDIQITGSDALGVIRSGKTSATDTTEGFWLANNNTDAEFAVGDATDFIRFDDNALAIETRTFELAANTDDLQISSTQKSMSLASGNILLDGGGNYGYARIGSSTTYDNNINISGSATQAIIKAGKTSFSDTTNPGFVIEKTNSDARFYVGDTNDGSFIKFDTSNDLQIKSQKVEIAANTDDLQISSTNASMSLAGGKILLDGGGNYGYIRVGGSTSQAGAVHISGSGNTGVIRAGKSAYTDTTQAGWILEKTATDSKFYVGDASDGSFIKFDSDTGIDISSEKFELAAGTDDIQISSTQKSMSIAGGAIKLAYSGSNQAYALIGSTGGQGIEITGSNYGGTIRSGKESISDTDAGFWLANHAGTAQFHVGDSTEYIKFDGTDLSIASAHLDITASNIDMTTDTFDLIATDLSISSTEASMSLGYDASAAHGITFKGGSPSWIRFGPKSSPTMELASTANTTNYLQIGGKAFGDTTAGIILGENSGVEQFEVYKDEDEYFKFTTGAGGLDVRTLKLRLKTTGLTISGSDGTAGNNKIMLGAATTVDAGAGFFVDGDGNFRIGTATTGNSYMKFASSNLAIRTDDLVIDTSKIDITTEHGGMISLGASSASLSDLSGTGVFLSGSGEFNLEYDSSNYIRQAGSGLAIVANAGFQLSSTSGNNDLLLTTTKFLLDDSATAAASVTRTTGTGVFMNNDGEFRAGVGGGNRIDFDGSTTLTLQSDTFSLTGTNLELSNTKFKLGTLTDVNDIADTSTGFYVDSSGNVLVKAGAANAGYIRATDTDVTIKTGEFVLGDATNYISGSGGAISVAADTFDLKTANLRVSSSYGGTIAMGATIPTSISGSGVFLSGSGDFLAGNHTGNRIQFNKDANAIVMKSTVFSLDATTVVIDSSANSGKIQLGPSGGPGSATGTTYAGAYLDGTGKFNFVGDSDNYIRFSATGLEIQTPNLTASAAGAVTMTGTVTADAGAIGGWYLTNSQISTTAPGAPAAANDMVINTSPYIAMGSTSPGTFGAGGIQIGTYGTIYGKFLVANSSDTAGHIKFDAETGDLHISSSTVLIGKSGSADGSGHQPAGAFVSMSLEGEMEISSSGFHFKPGGDGVLAGGNITFEKDGDITSNDYLIERSRLFGAGKDSPTAQSSGTPDTLTTGTNQADKYSAEDGLIMIESHVSTADLWTLKRDIYMQDLTINNGVYLETAGYRIFVRGTLTNSGAIRNDGTAGTDGGLTSIYSAGGGGAGAAGGSLASGQAGSQGGRGGYELGGADGGGGGGAGGSGGTIFISARYLAGGGIIRAAGGDGGDGGPGG